ncbi:bifunctional 3-(3-hydroxy-phenyl)propionate/3-hydroxycinnamic acid hydroxylase [Limnohabitans sp. B9-3]|uniref:bifunctional 3-(3-hydroxy-phenyl)propionate/3-hydroxycinnamic acid hydroxylase n=1 Tax=Limnohabitans sp. B9-3 TaxID=1100707 RepID=UPI000C1F11C4|nr:bifunctional 3-(3-hydroxy-phenyl)propionate/3-hydroxycinnamic acid hydroxylase [Limnohabitans sp. B9-3]PIT78554.1 FAD-binding monooxygenase [Limnohabitans sp. B9-3]
MSTVANQDAYDVAIVGFGPTGAIAAGLLGKKGIRTFVCDKSPDVYDKPRAIALDHEISRVFQHMGIGKKIKPFLEPFSDSVFYGVDGQVIKQMSTVAAPYPLSHTPSVVFSQPPVEKILRDYAESHASVTVALGWTLVDLTQDIDLATLSFKSEDGHTSQVKAKYVIGCDGASSSVRSLVGIALEDLGFDEPWLVVDVMVNAHGLAKLPKTSVQYCNPERPSTYVIGPGHHRRWEISINEGEDPKEVATPEGTWKLLAPWLTQQDGTLWRQASYRFHALVASQWRKGRVFVAGDAAHQQPPFLGQGMCQGVRDAVNLCWRLEAVLKNEASESLLDSYGLERKAHVIELTTRIKGIGQIITERDVTKARARDAKLLADCGGVVTPMPRQDVQPALSAGLLGAVAHPARGSIFPQPLLVQSDGTQVRMDDVYPAGWKIVFSAEVGDDFLQAAQHHHLPGLLSLKLGSSALTEAEGVLRQWFEKHQIQAAIVRPDHYIYGVCQTALDVTTQLQALKLV